VAHAVPDALGRVSRGLAAALRARRGVFALAAATVFVLDIAVPPIVLSLAKKPADYFTVNPWLVRLPGYLVAGDAPLGERLGKTWNLALFWFSADNPYGVEWGFAVTVGDLARFLSMAALIGAYFALWAYQRDGGGAATWASRAGAPGGVLGACSSVLGLATGGCTVMGCGAPVIPVVGLAFAGLSSTTLKLLSDLSTVATTAVLAGLAAGVVYLAWRVGAPSASTPARPEPAASTAAG